MRTRDAFEYAIVRVVPHVEREEFVNAAAIVYCYAQDLLLARIELDEPRLLALAPDVELDVVRASRPCPGSAPAAPRHGPFGALTQRERWHWLTAPRSTMLQTSTAHAGLCAAPEAWIERLLDWVVRRPRAP